MPSLACGQKDDRFACNLLQPVKLSSAFLFVAFLACSQASYAQSSQNILISQARGVRDATSSEAPKSSVPAEKEQTAEDALRSVRFVTRSKFIVMPVFDKSGSSQQYGSAGGSVTTTNEFATEVLNDTMREAGATTVSWFKVNSAMNKKFGQTGLNRADLTNDSFIPELMEIGKNMGVKYIIRPVILNMTDSSSTSSSVNPAVMIPVFGAFAGNKTKTVQSATVTIKIDIISTLEEDIIGARRFEGAVRDQKTSSGFSYSYGASMSSGGMSASAKGALFDAIYQSVDFISSKVD